MATYKLCVVFDYYEHGVICGTYYAHGDKEVAAKRRLGLFNGFGYLERR